ncbi:hypothetical protein BJ875DRAFT_474996 [Amylocarpus encephaloides]|uniref:MOSC domain-containing protein n=1 Tax=Amylocarpus encephaloides TaxID=45428 RepID=A0A9P8C0Y5_9HELO|nr:hypothetical protein BJ875DRAFT_474996 [Amylocarpus encephaloides]
MLVTPSWTSPEGRTLFLGAATVLISFISYFFLNLAPSKKISGKAARATRLREAFDNIEKRTSPSEKGTKNDASSSQSLKVKELWIYPIKSLRGCSVPRAMLTNEGFYLDRRFMLLKKENAGKPSNMHVSHHGSMTLFHPRILGSKILVVYRQPGTSEPSGHVLELDLEPSIDGLETLDVIMHGSPSKAYNMGSDCNSWFSERFGFDVVLAFWGGNTRLVLGNQPTKPTSSAIRNRLSQIPVVGAVFQDPQNDKIAFNDCAPYLVINQKSVDNVSTRLPDGMDMDLSKFRANIVVSSPSPTASPSLKEWDEDFWRTIEFPATNSRIILTGNCGRCPSLNVNYKTGTHAKSKEDEADGGVQVLRLLQKDRRVDKGVKYSPIFGRYGFVASGGEGQVVRVGDEVKVVEKNEEHTTFYWPELSTA